MKRIVHYFLLAAVLVGVPLVCAWLGGYDQVLADVSTLVPRCENWGNDSARLWRAKCPFSWSVFVTMGVCVIAAVGPFGKRVESVIFRDDGALESHALPRGRFPRWGWLALGVMVVGWILAWTRFEWFAMFQRYPYVLQWGGFIVLVNALCVKRCGHSPLTECPRLFLLLFPVSSLFWWFFEYLNRYVWNWFYVGIPGISSVEYVAFATLCFASVLPGVVSVSALLGTFRVFADDIYADMIKIHIRSRTSVVVLTALSLLGLTGIVFFPQFAYPLLWISPLTGFVLVQVLFKDDCVLDVLKTGNWGVVLRFAVAALICGLVWETWNYYSLAKWLYNVPWVERWKVWEMPILGFAGYLPFGVECAAVAYWVDARFVSRWRR